MTTELPTIRRAIPADADTIAFLHAESWRAAYRGFMADAFLDGPVHAERSTAWLERFSDPNRFVVFIAERGDAPCGFICWFPDSDPQWGGLVDNFHILPSEKGRGLGRRLFAAVMMVSAAERPGQPLFLTVLAGNVAAQIAYDRLGGRQADRFPKVSGDGLAHDVIRYVWPAPAIDGTIAATSEREGES